MKTTNAVAAAGLVLPLWMPPLEEVSYIAAQLVPILSAVWLTMRLASQVRRWWQR